VTYRQDFVLDLLAQGLVFIYLRLQKFGWTGAQFFQCGACLFVRAAKIQELGIGCREDLKLTPQRRQPQHQLYQAAPVIDRAFHHLLQPDTCTATKHCCWQASRQPVRYGYKTGKSRNCAGDNYFCVPREFLHGLKCPRAFTVTYFAHPLPMPNL
ncbi:hypothetical protein, partial [Mesorhizobium sp. M2A.F.Ca.ET.037.01.1.1]|uniref:hypothetical protein n=1 Tax=Mesorhizobium sp. M2A.F.Ca.ET.037.01.1.1 TaxID=2496748 RepID=UPI001AECBC34